MVLMYHELQSQSEVAKAFKKRLGNFHKANETIITRTYEEFRETRIVSGNVEMMKTKGKISRTTVQ